MSTPASDPLNDTPRRYIILLKEGVDKTAHFDWLLPKLSSQCKVTHDFDIIHGFAGQFTDASVSIIQSSGQVEKVEPDVEFEDFFQETQTPSPWGLNRISQKVKLTTSDESLYEDFKYRYNVCMPTTLPTIYIIDSGVDIHHEEFEGRATWGYVGTAEKEDSSSVGHGTAVASVAGGKFCGVYKHAHIIACKRGSLHGSDSLLCFQYVFIQSKARRVPTVVNMSFGFHDPSKRVTLLDKAVEIMVQAGIHVCIAAGNRHGDASETTPARAKGANTIGASNISDERARFSNWGSSLTLFAPGQNIRVADKKDYKSLKTMSGTSFASPHVAGLIAYLIATEGNLSPEQMTEHLKKTAVAGLLVDTEEHSLGKGSPNLLANNQFL